MAGEGRLAWAGEGNSPVCRIPSLRGTGWGSFLGFFLGKFAKPTSSQCKPAKLAHHVAHLWVGGRPSERQQHMGPPCLSPECSTWSRDHGVGVGFRGRSQSPPAPLLLVGLRGSAGPVAHCPRLAPRVKGPTHAQRRLGTVLGACAREMPGVGGGGEEDEGQGGGREPGWSLAGPRRWFFWGEISQDGLAPAGPHGSIPAPGNPPHPHHRPGKELPRQKRRRLRSGRGPRPEVSSFAPAPGPFPTGTRPLPGIEDRQRCEARPGPTNVARWGLNSNRDGMGPARL